MESKEELKVIFVNEGGVITDILVSDPSIEVVEVEYYSEYDDEQEFEDIMAEIYDSKMQDCDYLTVRKKKDFDENVTLKY